MGSSVRVGTVGAVLGVVAGLVQAVAGSAIPEWTGAKLATVPLGLLTVALSVLAGLAARRQGRPGLTTLGRAGCALGLVGPGLLGLSTVGRLWYVPAVLLVVAGVLTIDSWRRTAAALGRSWYRVLLSALGAAELLMAAGASVPLMVVGGIGGLALITAAWLPTPRTGVAVGLVVLGTVPFAVLGWAAVVPLLLTALAALLTVLVLRDARDHARA